MENRKNSLSVLKICRFCLSQDDTLTCIYDRTKKPKNAISLSLKILSCLSVEVFPSDRMPAYICKPCLFFIELFYKYKDICRKADESIMMHLQGGSSLEQMTWPSLLTKVFRVASKPGPVVNTVVEGATVQVTSQDGSDSEDEDDANIYNIKIGDESGEGSKQIKVITSSKEEKEKPKGGKGRQEDLSYEADLDEEECPPVKELESGGCWPCDECDCTYPLEQLLELHKKMKHRIRTVACNQCDQKFYSRNDLATHQLRHTDDMPFQCVACDKKFKRLIHLKRHEKVMHSEIAQLACPKCPATFLSLEELDAHQVRHAPNKTTSFPCVMCNKKFLDKHRLMKHVDNVHSKDPEFRCEYCPAQFTAISKLTRHVRTHAGERSYPCKYCKKTFIKSHHYTRHLRLKHRASGRQTGRAQAESNTEIYRCEQCSEPFESQDELIYHSAIHATQNLTCPLCQEKFDDVDAVTAHIKSHVNGMEFMCDLCELVFTSKEKLDKHLNAAHAEELDLDDSSMEVDGEEEDDDETGINVTEEDGEMVVEIKKTDNFLLPEAQTSTEERPDNTMFEDNSEAETTYTELATVDPLVLAKTQIKAEAEVTPVPAAVASATLTKVNSKPVESTDKQTAPILRKAEEVKRKVQQITEPLPGKKEKVVKVESSNSAGASDKSLRLLEKELQELKRTNTRNEVARTPVKPMEGLRNRRPQLYSSTPKTRAVEQKKELASTKTPPVEKKVPERRMVTKENKEPKEAKETKANAAPAKEEKKEEIKEKDTPKSVVKNGTNEKSTPEENVRRSTRPSKIRDYAKMIRDKSQESDDDSDDAEDEEYKEAEKTETRAKTRRGSIKQPAAKATTPSPAAAAALPATPAARKRGRPRKDLPKEVPAKVKKEDVEEDEEEKETDKNEAEQTSKKSTTPVVKEKQTEENSEESEPMDTETAANDANKSTPKETSPSKLLMSPSGQTLKK
ncbi:hypothetical protein ABMA28_012019, partial [Loxostege sticticalis]